VKRPLRILQLSTLDVAGGAEQVALNLHRGFRAAGQQAWLAVGHRRSEELGVLRLDNDAARGAAARALVRLGDRFAPHASAYATAKFRDLGMALTEPRRLADVLRGREDFWMPATRGLLELTPGPLDLLHGHNLHGDYFDLRALPRLSRRLPLLLTLHDMWALTGHCAYSLGCERWREACGACPDLTIYPPLRHDGTAFNLRRKREIYRASRLRVATPSRWLMEKLQASVLADGMVEARIIPYGIDLDIFSPEGRAEARLALGIPATARVLLYVAHVGSGNRFKDYATVEHAARIVRAELRDEGLLLLVVGGSGRAQREGQTWSVPYLEDRAALARYYRAADVFLHAAAEDNYPNTVLEALASGTPVVATAVGGIPEQIQDGTTGALVPSGDAPAMAAVALRLLRDGNVRGRMSLDAAADARRRFDLRRQVRDYLTWFQEAVASSPAGEDP
jgi:glycosyltransferase involved in cell wall biosynthesis